MKKTIRGFIILFFCKNVFRRLSIISNEIYSLFSFDSKTKRLFGIGTWLNLNGIWIELPILVSVLPEKWSLSPDLGLASNIANVGPLIIALIRFCLGKSSSYEIPSIIVIFLVGIFGPLILSLTWSKTIFLFGLQRSVYMLILSFFLALVNCTSSVTYLPFVNRFPSKWLNFYFAGESLSSLIPAFLGFIQGLTDEVNCDANQSSDVETKLPSTRFSIEVYFICLSLLMGISFVAFLLLCKFQPKKTEEKNDEQTELNEDKNDEKLNEEKIDFNDDKKRFDSLAMIYLGIIFWTSILLIGCIPSMNSYSLNPYGSTTFHNVLILCSLILLIFIFVIDFLHSRSMLLPVGVPSINIISSIISCHSMVNYSLDSLWNIGLHLHISFR